MIVYKCCLPAREGRTVVVIGHLVDRLLMFLLLTVGLAAKFYTDSQTAKLLSEVSFNSITTSASPSSGPARVGWRRPQRVDLGYNGT